MKEPWDVDEMEYDIGQPVKLHENYLRCPPLDLSKQSKWTCYMFGNRPGGVGIMYTPEEGKVPNRFVRWMMRICFDCLWVKKDT